MAVQIAWSPGALWALAAACGAALGGCAHMEAPPGGPADQTRPFVTGVYPAPGATGVPRDLKARFGFSEWVNPEAEHGVYLTPPPARRLKIKLNGNILDIASAAPLDSGTTYILGLSRSIKDLNGLPLETPYQLVFSTGADLDSGRLAGRISAYDGTRPTAGVAALYPVGAALRARFAHLARPGLSGGDSAAGPGDFPVPGREKPAYLAPADSLGGFAFQGLRPGQYALLAFLDEIPGLSPDLGKEKLAIGPANLTIGTAPSQFPVLAFYDTVPVRLTGAHWENEAIQGGAAPGAGAPGAGKQGAVAQGARSLGTVRLAFNRLPHPLLSLRPDNYSVRRQGAAAAVPVTSVCLNPVNGEIELFTAPLEADSLYTVRSATVDAYGNPIDTAHDTASFLAGRGPDTAAPALVFLGPRNAVGMRDKLPAADLVPGRGILVYTTRLLTDSGFADVKRRLEVKIDTVPAAFTVQRVSHHEFSLLLPAAPLKGQRLSVGLRAAGAAVPPPAPGAPVPAAPAAPSAPRDRAVAASSFLLADAARLGGVKVNVDVSARGSRLVARRNEGALEYVFTVPAAEAFTIDSLPAGRYAFDYFRDGNGDGIWSAGSLAPWTPQEPLSRWQDSLEVKPGAAAEAEGKLAWPPSGK